MKCFASPINFILSGFCCISKILNLKFRRIIKIMPITKNSCAQKDHGDVKTSEIARIQVGSTWGPVLRSRPPWFRSKPLALRHIFPPLIRMKAVYNQCYSEFSGTLEQATDWHTGCVWGSTSLAMVALRSSSLASPFPPLRVLFPGRCLLGLVCGVGNVVWLCFALRSHTFVFLVIFIVHTMRVLFSAMNNKSRTANATFKSHFVHCMHYSTF